VATRDSLDIKLLGELEVRLGGERVSIGDRRHRVVLGILLLDPGRAIQTDRLAHLVWLGEEMPRTARNAIQVSVSRLRAVLGEAAPIVRTGDGYAIEVPRSAIDLFRFRDLVPDIGGTPAATVSLLDTAIGLWHGPVLDGTFSDELRSLLCGGIDEEYVVAIERRLEIEIELGRNAAAIVSLAPLVRRYPQRERLISLYMLALYRDGQGARSIEVYNGFRDFLADSLGIDPGPQLQELALSILRGAADLSPLPMPLAVPAQLPPDATDFTGRAAVVASLSASLRAGSICVITGAGGSGKSTLAVHVAHRLAPSFPDGQLYVELHGMTESPVPPENVLGRFLRALGDSSTPPEGLDEHIARFRTLTANRRMLFVLDDAASAAQIRSLLPGSATCAVLVTSRKRLSDVAGATVVELGVLPPSEALSLFESIVGVDRVMADPVSASAIISSCGFLPLAVRIAGARLVTRKHWSLADLAARLSDSRRRLDELLVGDQEVRATIALTYSSLSPSAQLALRGLGFIGLPHFPVWVVTSLLEVSSPAGEAVIDELLDVHLVEFAYVDGVGEPRFRLHDLVRLFGASEATSDPVDQMLSRVAGGWFWLIDQINATAPSGAIGTSASFPRTPLGSGLAARAASDPRAWFDSEYTNLMLGIEQAAALDLAELSVELTAAVRGANAWWRTPARRTDEPLETTLSAVRRTGNLMGEARVLLELGQLRNEQDRYAEARSLLSSALALFVDAGDDRGVVSTLTELGSTCRDQGSLLDAASYLSRALAAASALDDPSALAYVQRFSGAVALERGLYPEAESALASALALYRSAGSRRGEALVLRSQSLVARAQAAHLQALGLASSAYDICVEVGDKLLAAYSQRAMGKALLRLGRLPEALSLLESSLEVSQALNDRWGAGVTLRSLGELHLTAGSLPDASRDLGAALEIWNAIGQPVFRARTLRDLALLASAQGEPDRAAALSAEAVELFKQYGAREAAEN
jgi:DNA-binding SARP family transcriptional activator/tetratricopeptide (TPR) repeat protein/energy-coupling factor transporter ATP-binding protein EcfA2